MPLALLVTNIGYAVSIIFTLGLGLFVFLKNPKEQTNLVYFLFVTSWSIFQISYIIGINIADSHLSRMAFMWNLATLFAPTLSTHLIFCITKSVEKIKKILLAMYSTATLLCIFFILNPDRFLLPSAPKIYYKNFFVLGDLYFLGDLFFYGTLLFFFISIFYSFFKANVIEKNRLKYFMAAIVTGYIFASLPAFILYDINIDPFWSFLAGPIYAIPMAYAIIRYDIIDIKVVAKRALIYALGVGAIMFFFIILNSINNRINEQLPFVPIWIVPFLSSLIAVSIGIFIWKKIKEVDVLKYEFINIIMHKFRTPLTAVKWSLDTLTDPAVQALHNDTEKNAVGAIKTANDRLIVLTNIVAGLTFLENKDYEYSLEKADLSLIMEEVRDDLQSKIKEKNLDVSFVYDKALPEIKIDKDKIKFTLQTIMENAINYTPNGGIIKVGIEKREKSIRIRVADSGIGISKNDLPYIFGKFYRGKSAQDADTEGMGIGLYLTRDIIRRHGGKISAESEGPNKGAIVSVQLPIIK
ncbi:MAG TPA: HAMP domain-containing sensor histidine kinase [Candidatus Paceibacterota bacterium]